MQLKTCTTSTTSPFICKGNKVTSIFRSNELKTPFKPKYICLSYCWGGGETRLFTTPKWSERTNMNYKALVVIVNAATNYFQEPASFSPQISPYLFPSQQTIY